LRITRKKKANLGIHLTGKNESLAAKTVKFQFCIDYVSFLLDYAKIK